MNGTTKADKEQHLSDHGMSWGDSHGKTFTEQAEARSRADHPGEKVALSATATQSKRFGCPVRVGISRRRALESPNRFHQASRVRLPGAMPSDDR